MPPRKGNRGKQDWLNWSSDEDGDGAGPSGGKSKKKSGKPSGWGGNKGHVHGLDRRLAAAEAASTSRGKVPAFALRDIPASDAQKAANGTQNDTQKKSSNAAPNATLVAMFGDALPPDTIEDVFLRCGRDVETAIEALLQLTTAEDTGIRNKSPEKASTASTSEEESQTQNNTVDLWDVLPTELRLLILDHLGVKDSARAARTCRDFASTVSSWRANKKHVTPPPTLTIDGVCSLINAYPNLESLSLKKCLKSSRGCIKNTSDVFRVLRAAARGPAGRKITSIDLEGCEFFSDGDVVALLESFRYEKKKEDGIFEEIVFPIAELKLGKCASVSDKALVALSAHPAGAALKSLSVAGTLVTASGARQILSGRATGGLPLLAEFDISGCINVKGPIALPPLSTVKSLRALYLPGLTQLTAQLPKSEKCLTQMHVSQCVNLTSLHVSAFGLKKLNVSQCKRLTKLEMHCASLQILNLQHCASLISPVTFTSPALTELNISGCLALHTGALRSMASSPSGLELLRCEGCVSLEGELLMASRVLKELVADGCSRLVGIRVAAPVERLTARRCKSLQAVWVEQAPELEEGEPDEEERVLTHLKLDLRNCTALTRLVGLRTRAAKGKLQIKLTGCTSLPESERPTGRGG